MKGYTESAIRKANFRTADNFNGRNRFSNAEHHFPAGVRRAELRNGLKWFQAQIDESNGNALSLFLSPRGAAIRIAKQTLPPSDLH
jgi:hypothetical protein